MVVTKRKHNFDVVKGLQMHLNLNFFHKIGNHDIVGWGGGLARGSIFAPS